MYMEGKTSKTINEEILKGDHPDLAHKYTEAVVNGQLGRINAYEVIDNIVLIDLLSVPRVEDFDIKVKSLIQYE